MTSEDTPSVISSPASLFGPTLFDSPDGPMIAVWTGSCPCPSFSAAGKGEGFDDARHLWPDWARLIRECKPPVIFGEQADDAIGYGWLDLVQTDLEAADVRRWEGGTWSVQRRCAAHPAAALLRSRRLDAPESSSIGGMVDSECERGRGRQTRSTDAGHVGESVQVGPLRGFWADAEWIPCRNLAGTRSN
jgi:DNA (cytosine-5)-methyltransferase 1